MTPRQPPRRRARPVPLWLKAVLVVLSLFGILCLVAAACLAVLGRPGEPVAEPTILPLPHSTVRPVEVTPVTATLAASDGGTVTCTGPAIHWKGDVHAGQAVTVTYSAQVRPEVVMDLHRVTNTMVLTHDGTTLSRQASFLLGHTRFLPLVDHGGTP